MKHCAVAVLLLLAACAASAAPGADAATDGRDDTQPPVSPVPLVWQPGHWDWTGSSYVWAPGQYVDAGGPQRDLDAGLLGEDRLGLGLAAGALDVAAPGWSRRHAYALAAPRPRC